MTNMQGLQEEVKILSEVELGVVVLNSRQCKNLLVNFQRGVEAIQSIIDGLDGLDVFHQVWQDMIGVMKKGRYLVEECSKVEDWCRMVVMQMNNKESFRELLWDFECCFHTMCDIFCYSFPNLEVKIQNIEKSTTFYPTSIDQVEQDQESILKRLSKEVDSCKVDKCKDHCTVLRYLMERLRGLQKVAGGELDSIVFPYTYPSPEYGMPPEPLGKGGFGTVYSTQWLGFDTATKVIKVNGFEHETLVRKEASILGGLDHPNIIKMFCCGLKCDSHGKESKMFEIVMERGYMSLSNFLELDEKPLAEEISVDIMIQIASGMCYLHDMKVAHRDLKPDNVILTSSVGSKQEHVHVKILDFGISKIEVKNFPQVPTNGGCFGTIGYMAPEAYSKRSSEVDAFKTDVFSFGMMCYEILSNKRANTAIKGGDYVKSILENERPELPITCSKDLKSLIQACWSSKPLERPTFLDIIKKLRKLKSDAMVKVASDVESSSLLEESTNTNNSIGYSKQCWTMLIQKLDEFNVWWQMFIGWFSRYLTNSLMTKWRLFPSAQENPNITTLQMVGEVNKQTNGNSKLVGLEGKILELETLLQCIGSLGIVGMGGIGKSTLANALSGHISHEFDATCFVGDFTNKSCAICVKNKLQGVKESSQTHTLKEGHKFLKELQRTKRVLVVLDNVGKASQLEVLLGDHTWQGVHGSKLIATSRSWKSLQRYVPTIGRVDMKTLHEEQSKELFSIHAFAANEPCLPYLEHVVEKIVKACDGLPLSLEVMGSYVYGKKRLRIWERTLQRLLRARHDGSEDGQIWQTLRIGFDELNEKEQSMFLDIVCFICKGSWPGNWVYTKETIRRIIEDDVKLAQETLESLEDKSLLKFDRNGFLEVHDQLRDMGHMIVEKEFQQTRLWNLSLATFLKYWNQKSIELVEGLSFTTFERSDIPFQSNVSVNMMKNLRILSIQNCDHMDMLLSIIRETDRLKWLRIHFSTLHDNNLGLHTWFMNEFMNIANDHLQKLGILEIFNLKICIPIIFQGFQPKFLKELSFINCTIPQGDFPNGLGNLDLEELHICKSKDLKKFPQDFIHLTALTTLDISECESLEEIPFGLHSLQALEELSFHGCTSLKKLREGIGGLNCLKKLHMWDCIALEEFPSGISTLKALKELSFTGCKSLKKIPEGIGGLNYLKILCMRDCIALEEFPSGICTLKALEELSFSGCKALKTIPEGIGGLNCLKILCMGDCTALEEFPLGICTLKALQELRFYGCKALKTIPEGIVGLSCLRKLYMWDCTALEEFPSGICTLKGLEELSFTRCKALKTIPEGIVGLSCLKKLYMWDCKALEEFPLGICTLKALKELSFSGCKALKTIPEGIAGLSCLKKLHMWDCTALEEFPSGISTLKALEELLFTGCKSLKTIPEGIAGLNCLKILRMGDCTALEEFLLGICTLKALEELSFTGCKSLKTISEGITGLNCLKILRMGDCTALEEFLSGICTLKALEELSFTRCKYLKKIPEGIAGLSCLKILRMGHCTALEEYPSGICTLKALEKLSFTGCKSLKTIPEGITDLNCLKILRMGDCIALEEFPSGICTLKALEELSFHGSKSLKTIPEGIVGLSCLRKLYMWDCTALEEFPLGICTLKALEELSFNGCKSLKTIPEGIAGLNCLKILRMGDCTALEEFPLGICTLKALEELSFTRCKCLKKIPEGIVGLSCLKILRMGHCTALEEFPSGLWTLKALEELSFTGCKSLKTIPEGIGGLNCLKILRMGDCTALEEFPSGICTLKALEELSFTRCKYLKKIPEGIVGLSCLKILRMGRCTALEEFPLGICTLKALEELSFHGCKSLKTIPEGIVGLSCLKKLYMWDCTALEEFPLGICTLTGLEELCFYGCKSLKTIPERIVGLSCLKIFRMGDCTALEEFPLGICTLKVLEELSFHECKSLKKIPEGIGGLNCLKIFRMGNCTALEEFP